MKRIGLQLLFCGLLAAGQQPAAISAEAESCKLVRLATIQLESADDFVYVPVTLNGTNGRLRLSMGSPDSSLYDSVVKSGKLRTHDVPNDGLVVSYIDGHLVKEYASFDSLLLGNANLGKGAFLVSLGRPPKTASGEPPILGTLGVDVFQHLDVELDLAHDKLSLFSPDHCPGQVVYWSGKYSSARIGRGRFGDLMFPVELEGKYVQATLTTADEGSSISTDVTRSLYGFDDRSSGTEEAVDSSGKSRTYYRAMKLTAQGLEVTNTKLRLRGPAKSCELSTRTSSDGIKVTQYDDCSGTPLLLGLGLLRKLRIYFAMKEEVMYFTAADAVVR